MHESVTLIHHPRSQSTKLRINYTPTRRTVCERRSTTAADLRRRNSRARVLRLINVPQNFRRQFPGTPLCPAKMTAPAIVRRQRHRLISSTGHGAANELTAKRTTWRDRIKVDSETSQGCGSRITGVIVTHSYTAARVIGVPARPISPPLTRSLDLVARSRRF